MGVLIMGSDLVAVDATCCRLMQLDPERVGYLVLGNRKKLGHIAGTFSSPTLSWDPGFRYPSP